MTCRQSMGGVLAGGKALLFCLLLGAVLAESTASAQGDPAILGQWSAVQKWPVLAVHAHLLPTGKVLFYPLNDVPYLWDPVSNTIVPTLKVGYNLFCGGHAFLADGQLMSTGGHVGISVGLAFASTYDSFTETWTRLPDMNAARWYPSTTTLPNGDAIVISGDIDVGIRNLLPQVWQTASGTWRDLTGAQLAIPLYPYAYVAPNGKIFIAGWNPTSRYLDTSGTGAWTTVANSSFGFRQYGTSVMYEPGKVMILGGADPPTATAEVIDLGAPTPTWRNVAPMSSPRQQPNSTLLPDGKVLVIGGSRGAGIDNSAEPALAAELWDPITENWTTMASASVYRGYHSVSLLLPDGRVLSAGGNLGGASAQIYSPPYLFRGARPAISTSRTKVAYARTFFVGTPNGTSIAKVTWVRLGSVTHGFDQNQRINPLSFSQTTGGIRVTTPASGALSPPGHYMLFLLNGSGVPSLARMVRIGAASGSAPSAPTGLSATAVSGNQINLAWTDHSGNEEGFLIERSLDGVSFVELAEVPPDLTAYSDLGLAGGTQYFYRVRAYNLAGDSAYSNVAADTTLSAPAAPGNLSATAPSESRIDLSWTDNAHNEEGFRIERSPDGSSFSEIATVAANQTTYANTGLSSGTTYHYRVRAYNALGNSDYSGVAMATTLAAAVSLAPATLIFSSQLLNTTSPAQQVTLTNSGSATLTLSAITTSGDFARTHNCGGSLAAGAGCSVSVTFTPTATGTRSGQLSVSSNAAGSPHTVSLSGTGVTPPVASLAPASLGFGNQLVNTTSAAMNVTLSNSGGTTLTLSAITISGDFAQANDCGESLGPAGSSCTINVTFIPTAAGTRGGQISVSSNAAGSPHTVGLTGTGVNPPAVGLSPASLSFGDQVVGTTSVAQALTLTNTGGAVLTISAITASGDFTRTTTCGSSLGAGNSCSVSVAFTPTAAGTRNGQVSVSSDAAGSPHTVDLTGLGVNPPAVSLSPASLNFGDQVVGTTSVAQPLTLTNSGGSTLTISSITASGDFARTSTCGSSLGAGGSCSISVTFAPTAAGTRSGQISVSSDAAGSPHTVDLAGSGSSPPDAPAVDLSPASLNFGDQVLGETSAIQTVTLTNAGGADLNLGSIAAGGDFAQTNTCTALLGPSASCSIHVTFTPSAIAARSGQVTISDNAAGSP
ncbi:MAG: choice-of-anchor D domain-containing protein, partial [Acidobacteria bacterium]|nr:choice-of-anchor D domain-containing protein [Acidobacteriota bacterium]